MTCFGSGGDCTLTRTSWRCLPRWPLPHTAPRLPAAGGEPWPAPLQPHALSLHNWDGSHNAPQATGVGHPSPPARPAWQRTPRSYRSGRTVRLRGTAPCTDSSPCMWRVVPRCPATGSRRLHSCVFGEGDIPGPKGIGVQEGCPFLPILGHAILQTCLNDQAKNHARKISTSLPAPLSRRRRVSVLPKKRLPNNPAVTKIRPLSPWGNSGAKRAARLAQKNSARSSAKPLRRRPRGHDGTKRIIRKG